MSNVGKLIGPSLVNS